MRKLNIKESTSEFVNEKQSYYKQWILDEPLVISKSHNDDLQLLQKIMYKLITEFVTNYSIYKHLMPVSSKVEEIINIFNHKEYKIGTYRTDFVYDCNQQVKLIEITCRFALNGMFLSSVLNKIADQYHSKHLKHIETDNPYNDIYKHFESYLKNVDSVVILKGGDVRNESKIYADIFKRMGYPLTLVDYKEIEENLEKLQSAWVISELSFDEITSLNLDLIRKLMPLNIINDFRTIFLIHDKRFFSVLGNSELRKTALTDNEIKLFERYYIPTYSYGEKKELWEKAKKEKDKFILKHRSLGKSEKVYAGIVTEKKVWDALFEADDLKDLILQEWITQTKIKGTIDDDVYEDYITGTLLFFDDNYFGFGDFRTSSFPVTNQGDHRKACSIIRANNKSIDLSKITNYIN